MNSTKKLIWTCLLSSCVVTSLYAADNCTGYFGNEMASETIELSKGVKVTFFTNTRQYRAVTRRTTAWVVVPVS